jgi:DNA-binding NarL/FixJ family response regulator
MIKMIVCEDHPIFREGLRKILVLEKNIKTDEEVSDRAGLMDKLETHHYDVIILDISLPDANGLNILNELRKVRRPPVLILSMHPEEQFATQALRAGGSWILRKRKRA